VALAVMLALASGRVTAQRPSTADVLAKAASYLASYEKEFSVVVAEESYLQTVVARIGSNKVRTLRSDVLQTSVGQDAWVAFRDVFEVNGEKVRDRDTRLQKLFLEAPSEAISQSRRIAAESARFNIGALQRNINVPTMALTFLRQKNQPRSVFTDAGRHDIDGANAVLLTFTEKARPTIVRSGTRDLPATGRFWIDPESGRVLKTEVVIAGAGTPAKITVTYRPVPKMTVWAPVVMTEVYDGSEMIRAEATYSNFRQFAVAVSEIIK
jgi:hypothetical protein